jgi:hypothetical protein
MPIEIRELVIRTVVEHDPAGPSPGQLALDPQELLRLKREIAAECLERLRDELAARTDR